MTDWTPRAETSGKPRYIAIADAIEKDVRDGRLSPGTRLPPQRMLAKQLGIDFTTVSRGYSEAQSRGLVTSHVGRGTFISKPTEAPNGPDPLRLADEDLSMNLPPEPTDPGLIANMRAGLDYVSANLLQLLRYQSSTGSDKDKAAASTWLSLRGMIPSSARLVISPGAHSTICAILTILTEPGDTILCEQITYPGFRNIASRRGLNLVGIEMDKDGILPDALSDAIRTHGPKALYLNPTLQNPTTLTIPTDRRLAISEVLNKHGLQLIEDDAYGFIPAKAPAPIAVSAPDLTWHIGGLAKCIGAGLRLAYTVAPNGKQAYSLGQTLKVQAVMPSPITTALATQWIEDGTADQIRRFIRSETSARQAIAREVLEGFDFRGAENAFNVWLSLPEGVGRADVVARMAGRPIGIMPSDAFSVGITPGDEVRLCLGGSLSREALRANLYFLVNSLQHSAFLG
ncbi:PLP-dependent aminotransferase family protein [Sagittula sp. MA-2]|jgi:DNA-binding transcriptional MocR family regulator|uniref:aminotransferase-like domain-containing protein n=1 Tax=Sagittula sp. MA-2 TaxID=3048007 RepID=UPI0024C3FB47|nr:PLP-dependent aminotransferase family protein [Sagittula sp. MA-2]WHZ37887.1 PLP-dependent aminotransferase family protein [Sagittula sp. MA-2]